MADKDDYTIKLSDLDLKKKYPNYFNIWIFRSTIILMIIIFIYVLSQEGWQLNNPENIYLSCSGNVPCTNPLYICSHNNNIILYNQFNCKQLSNLNIKSEYYEIEFINPGETIGRNPQYSWVLLIYFILLLCSFILNHIFYLIFKWRKKDGNK